MSRATTPPPAATTAAPATPQRAHLTAPRNVDVTPEQVRRLENERLKAKAAQQESTRDIPFARASKRQRLDEQGRPEPSSERGIGVRLGNGDSATAAGTSGGAGANGRIDTRNAGGRRNRDGPTIVQSSYIEYDFSKMQDSKGGFMVEPDAEGEAAESWAERQQRLLEETRRLNPPISADPAENPKCFECSRPELDFQFLQVFGCRVCHACKAKQAEKYSLLTKTECKEDYLLTDPELRDEELMPHLLKPNPHNKTYSSMMLYLRYQVEEFAYKKWSGPEGLDREWERRVEEKKQKKDKKFEQKLRDLRRKTRTAKFSKAGARRMEEKHVHDFSGQGATDPATGTTVKVCSCGMESEEISL